MISRFLLRSLGVVSLLVSAGAAEVPDPLRPLRWQHRVLVLYVPEHPRGKHVLATWEASLRREKSGLADRDLVVLHAGPIPEKTPGYALPLTVAQKALLRQRLQLGGPEPQVVLLGKDGTVKRRQKTERLDLAALFALIDTMPMRQEEMRRR